MADLPVDPTAMAPSVMSPSLPALPQTMGIPRDALEPMHPSVRTAFDLTVDALQAHGVTFVDVPWPDPELLEAVGFILMMAESAAFHRNRMRSPELFDPQVAELLEAGSTVSAMDHLQALRVQTQLAQWFDDLFDTTPILITPTLPCLPPPLGSDTFTPIDLGSETQPLATAHTRFTLAANIAGSPAGSLPCGLQQGFPVGLQVMGRRGSDLNVLSVMGGIESVLAHENLWQPGSIATQFGGL
jgi:aspartyl-tRNA(Asn)/glutamyl-tRNA(Gln) amidotransferase subunit A